KQRTHHDTQADDDGSNHKAALLSAAISGGLELRDGKRTGRATGPQTCVAPPGLVLCASGRTDLQKNYTFCTMPSPSINLTRPGRKAGVALISLAISVSVPRTGRSCGPERRCRCSEMPVACRVLASASCRR